MQSSIHHSSHRLNIIMRMTMRMRINKHKHKHSHIYTATPKKKRKSKQIKTDIDHFKTATLPSSLNNEHSALQELHDLIILYQQAVHDVHQALVDVKETSQDVSYKIKSVTEQLHMIIDRREDELLEEITKKTASKVFALDSQFTKLKQRLMFCCEARDEEAEELLTNHYEYNGGIGVGKPKTQSNYNARKERANYGDCKQGKT
eukprot:210307_1